MSESCGSGVDIASRRRDRGLGALAIVLATGAACGHDEAPVENQEIIDNLLQAGFRADDIMVVGAAVYVGRDAQVSLAASREMLQPGSSSQEQFQTTNVVSPALGKICVHAPAFTGTFGTALDLAIENYNELPLTFAMARTPSSGCGFTINAVRAPGGAGGVAGFPSGGLPFDTVTIFDGLSSFGVDTIEHVITHELGHTIGLRHSDYFNRSISCGVGGDEGQAGVGAIHIPGTPTGAVVGGSIMNSCFRSTETGELTASDITALDTMYGLRNRFAYQGDAGWWDSGGNYTPDATTGRVVSGDFNGDGFDDVASLYRTSATTGRVHVLLSTGLSFQYQGNAGWWDSGSNYTPDATTGRVVSGDYNGDGRDDIAMFYKYASTWGRVHVLLSTGSSFQYQGDAGWWDSGNGYSADAFTGRMVSGDYNSDGRDDIAMFYKYGDTWGRIHVLLSTGTAFQYQGDAGWWDSGGNFTPDATTGRMISGDFNADGRGDIAWLYRTTTTTGRVHVLLSTGVSFQYQGNAGWWDSGSGYTPDATTGRVVSGDYNADGRDDIALFYRYASTWGRVHVLLSTGTSFQYQGDAGWWDSGSNYSPDAITGRMVSGDFNADGRDDITMFYGTTSSSGRQHVLLSR